MSVQAIVELASERLDKWKSIKLQNLCKASELSDLEIALPLVQVILVRELEGKVSKLVQLEAPDCVLGPTRRMLVRAVNGQHPTLSIIRRFIRRAS